GPAIPSHAIDHMISLFPFSFLAERFSTYISVRGLVPHLTIHMVPFYYSRTLFARKGAKKRGFTLSSPKQKPGSSVLPGGVSIPLRRSRRRIPFQSAPGPGRPGSA